MAPPPLLDMVRELIALPSVSSVIPGLDQSNRAVIDRLAQWLADLGFRTDLLPVPDHPGKYNLVATLGQGTDGLVLAGHTDTVPYDIESWTMDPFRLEQRDQRLYGLGTCDMKGFLALAIEAVRDIDPKRLKAPLIILATADEETTMAGARALTRSQLQARYAVIGEPTSLRPVRMHKGMWMQAIHLHGRGGHSSDPSLGVSALEGMQAVMGELLRWRAEIQQHHRDPRFRVPVPTLNLGTIHGGDNPNRICANCELHFDLRTLPGMDYQEIEKELRGRVEQVLPDTRLRLRMESTMPPVPPMETPEQSAVVQSAQRLCGHPAEAAAFGTEAPFLNALGLETVVLGPGDIAQAHQPDEYLALDRLTPTLELLHGLLRRFLQE